jgi:RNA polymerase sigma-54 factor
MALENRLSLNLKLSQKLVMNQSMQQAIRLLQLSRLELLEEINQELLENPFLDNEGDDGYEDFSPTPSDSREESSSQEESSENTSLDEVELEDFYRDQLEEPFPVYERGTYDEEQTNAFENMVSSSETLFAHLESQLNLLSLSSADREIGLIIIGEIDHTGYLHTPLSTIAEAIEQPLSRVERIWTLIADFHPHGVGARSLQECLLTQLAFSEWADSDAERILLECFDELTQQNFTAILERLSLTQEELKEALSIIRRLDPKPGLQIAPYPAQHIIPDVRVQKVGDDYEIILENGDFSHLKLNAYYRKMLQRRKLEDKETVKFLKEKERSAQWLLKCLDLRHSTLYKVVEALLRHQRDFFDHGIEHMRPLVLREIAEDIGMHESTVSRIVNNKYVQTHSGVFSLKYFFRSGITSAFGEDVSSLAVKEKIKKLIGGEPARKPLSDDALRKHLEKEGIHIARRTIAKYREELGIPPSSKRKNRL